MAEFNTSQAQNRWNNLAKGDQATLEKIMRGQGNMQDFRKIQSLIGRYDRLASSIFNQAVKALEVAAKTRVDDVAARRADRGKPLTDERISELLDIANKKAFDDAGPELVVIIEESMASQLEKQDARLDSIFAQRLRESIPDQEELEKQLDQIQDQGAVDEEEKRWNARVAEFKTWMGEQLKRFDGIEERVEQRAGFAVRQALNGWKLSNASAPSPEESRQAHADEATATAFVGTEDRGPVVGSANKSYTDEQLGRIGDSLASIAEQGDDDEEQKKANTWWRSFKSTIGDFGSRTKDALKAFGGSGLLGSLAKIVGTVLVAELLGGKVFEKIGEFLSSGKLQEWGGQFLKFITDNAKKLTDWVVGQFKSAREQRDVDAGVAEGDSEALVEAKRDLLVQQKQLEHGSQYWGTTPEDNAKLVKEAKERIAKQQQKVDELEKQQADEKAASSGKVGAAPDATTATGGAGGSGGIPGPSSNPGAPPGSTSSPVTSADGSVADAATATSAGPLASKGADQPFIPGLGTGAADTRKGDPATSMYTINNSPTLSLGDSITTQAQGNQTATLPGSAPQVNGSASQVNLSNFRRTPGDDTLTLMNLGMYTS